MSYKTIVVQLDTSRRAQTRLEYAVQLAARFDAHLTGVFAVFTPDPKVFRVMEGSAFYFEEHRKLRDERRAGLERLFHSELVRSELRGQWIESGEYANDLVPRLTRCADLLIAGQDDPNDPESFIADNFPETLVMSSGRPVLLIPYAGTFPTLGANVMVAWNGSREATRAVHDSLPFLKRASKTTIVTLNGLEDDPGTDPHRRHRLPGADIALVLARHGVKADVAVLDDIDDVATGDMLLTRVSDLSADLVVMGAYGHARWKELVMGGATRTTLAAMTVPVLMSH
jgi:nucleotide-binding universal stress UspA family protein